MRRKALLTKTKLNFLNKTIPKGSLTRAALFLFCTKVRCGGEAVYDKLYLVNDVQKWRALTVFGTIIRNEKRGKEKSAMKRWKGYAADACYVPPRRWQSCRKEARCYCKTPYILRHWMRLFICKKGAVLLLLLLCSFIDFFWKLYYYNICIFMFIREGIIYVGGVV